MQKRSFFERLLRGSARRSSDQPRPADALQFQPRLRRLEDRRVLAAGSIAVDAGADVTAAVEGTLVSLSGATFTDSDAGNHPHSATIDWGDGSPPTSATITEPSGADPGTISGTHVYADEGAYTITVTVTGADLESLSDQATVHVLNAAPVITGLNATPAINENGSWVLEGTFEDSGTLDKHKVVIDWGDGTVPVVIQFTGGERSFLVAHQFRDDNPTGTPADNLQVKVTVTDDDGGIDTEQLGVTVQNVPPGNLTISLDDSIINEDGSVTLKGSFTDPGPFDTHTVAIDWGNGETSTLQLPIGQHSFEITHTYADDNPSGTAQDSYLISVKVTDDDTGSTSATTEILVRNVAPDEVVIALSDLSIDEHGNLTLNGSFVDPGSEDAHEIVIDWGDGSPPTVLALPVGQRTFQVVHPYLDDDPSGTASDSFTITVQVTDDDLGTATAQATVTVVNVAPEITDLAISSVLEGQTATLSGTYSDVGMLDTHTLDIDWNGDGIYDEVGLPVMGGSFAFTHTYADDQPSGTPGDTFQVRVRLHDDDGGMHEVTVSQTVTNVEPQLVNVTGSTIDEHGVATVTATINDPGTQDVFAVAVDWQDGSPADTITGLGLADASGTVGSTSFVWVAATRSLTLSHQYLDDGTSPGNGVGSDTYLVSLQVSDDDTGIGTATATVIVNNVSPTLVDVAGSTIDEHGVATVTATIYDPGTQDVFAVAVDWQDGSVADTITGLGLADASGTVGSTSYVWVAATRSLTLSHQYLDDGTSPGNGTGTDAYLVSLQVTDDDTGLGTAAATVTVNNVSPTLVNVAGSTIDENGMATVTATIDDPGTQDVFAVDVDWQDGSPADTITGLGLSDASGTVGSTNYVWIATTRSLTLTHQYGDDGPPPGNGTDSDTYSVSLQVTDDDAGVGAAIATVVVNNVNPALIDVTGSTIDEHGIATVSATIDDPSDQDIFAVTVDWQDGSPADTITDLGLADSSGTVGSTSYVWIASTRSLTLTHQYLDDGTSPGNGTASDTYQVSLQVTDDDAGVGTATATVVVNNVSPSLINVIGSTINENDLATVTASIDDPGTRDVFDVTVNWQDGNPADTIAGLGLTDSSGTVGSTSYVWDASTRSLTLAHQYLDDGLSPGNATSSDTYTVSLQVTDDDADTDVATATVVVNNVSPALIDVTGSTINENELATVTATIYDPGTQDIFDVTVNWQDGNPTDSITGLGLTDSSGTVGSTSYVWIASTRNLTLTHQYLDDGPAPGNGTASDTYIIALAIRDDDLGTGSTQTTVVVNNVAPDLINIQGTTIQEDSVATISAQISDPGTRDNFAVTVDWLDGSPTDTIIDLGATNASGIVGSTTYQWEAATRTLTLSHHYLDDGPSPGNGTASDTYEVLLNVVDDDLGEGEQTAPVVVENAIPNNIQFTATSTVIQEMDSISISGTFTDAGRQDQHTVMIDWGDGTPLEAITTYTSANGLGTFTAAHQYLDDNPSGSPFDVNQIRVFVLDDDGGVGVGTLEITVNNVAPIISIGSATQLDITGNSTINFAFSDIGVQDSYTVLIDWGDGTQETILLGPGTTSYSRTHQYLAPPDPANPANDIPIKIMLLDDDLQGDSILVLADVPGKHVFGVVVDLQPPAEPLEFPPVSNVSALPSATLPPAATTQNISDRHAGNEAVVGADRKIVLRSVTIRGVENKEQEIILPEDQLDDMASLFRKLPDGRYRIYLRQDKIERLMFDVTIRQGKPVDPGNENDGTRDRPPTSQAPATDQPQIVDDAPAPQPDGDASTTEASSLPVEETDWSKPARLLRALRKGQVSC